MNNKFKSMKLSFLAFILIILLVIVLSGCNDNIAGDAKFRKSLPDRVTKSSSSLETLDSASILSTGENVLSDSDVNLFSIKKDTPVEKKVINEKFKYDHDTSYSSDSIPEVSHFDVNFNIPSTPISAISVSGNTRIYSSSGFARIIMVDSNNQKWLILGSDFMFIDNYAQFDNICEETCLFDSPVIVKSIEVELLDSKIEIDKINFQSFTDKRTDKTQTDLRTEQHNAKVDLVNYYVGKKNLDWTSGDTTVSKKLYRDLKQLQYDTETLRIPYEFFFYKGGVYTVDDTINGGLRR